MANKTYIGLHPNNLNRTKYGEITLYVEGEPVAFFSGSSNVTFSGSLGIKGIADVSASIASLQASSNPSLQDVTDNGNTTTTEIYSRRVYSNYGFTITGSSSLTGFSNVNGGLGSLYDYGLRFVLDHTNGSVQSNKNTINFESSDNSTGSFELRHEHIGGNHGASLSLFHTPGVGNPYINGAYQAILFNDFQGFIQHKDFMSVGTPNAGFSMYETGSVYNTTHIFAGAEWLTTTGNISGSDIYIDDWGSVSASLAELSASAASGAPTLQQVTDQGNTTTNSITIENPTLGEYGLSVIANNDYPLLVSSSNLPGDPYLKIGSEGIISVDSHTSKFTLYVSTNGGGTLYRAFEARTTGIYSTGSVSAGGNVNAGERLTIGIVDNATTDLDKFLVLDGSGDVKYRTGAQLASDISANLPTPTLHQVTGQGNTTPNGIEVGTIATATSASIGTTLNIGTVNNANTDTDKFLVLDLSGGVRYRTGTEVASDIGALTATPNLQAVTDIGATTTNSITAAGLNLTSVSNAGVDTDKFLVLDSSGNVDYRTGAEVLSDIGAGASSLDLQDVTDNGNTTTNDISAAGLSGSGLYIDGDGNITGDLVVGGKVTAQEFHTEFVSASIIFQDGSTKFGDSSGDKHAFTGSVSIKDVPNADGDRDKFLVIDSTGKIEYRSGSQVLDDIGGTQSTFDGNRGITQFLLPSLLNYNPGTTTVEDFLDAVFYPPSPEDFNILSNEPFSVLESAESGSIVGTGTTGVGTTQAEFTIDTSATITWSLQSTSIFQINSSTGKLSLNTDFSGSATYSAPRTLTGTVVATSNLGSIKTQQFYVTVVENAAPTITFQTLTPNNANTTTAASFGTITITDLPQGVDTVSIDELNGPDSGSFTINSPTPGVTTVYALSSSKALNSGSYSLEVTGSDSYDNIVSASFTVSVAENLPPVITQTGFVLETDQATSGSNIGTITVTDPQSDSISSFSFVGSDASLFNAIEASSTATSKTYNVQPFNDLSDGSFNITGSGTDSFGLTTLEPIENTFTLPVPDAPTPNGTFYIIESAESGSFIYTNSNGFSGTKAKFTSDQTGTWSIQGSTILAISQSGELSIKQHLSGSATQYPGNLTGTVKITNNDAQSATSPISVTLVDNLPATVTENFAKTTFNEAETAGAIGLGTIVVADPQAYENVAITSTSGSAFTVSTETAAQSVTYTVSSSGALTTGTYRLAVTASDSYGQDTKELYSFVIQENLAPTVTPTGFVKEITDVTSGSVFGTVVAADPQTDSIVDFSITGPSASLFNAIEVSSTATSKTYQIQPFNDLAAGSYDISGSAKDSFGLETTASIANEVTLPVPEVPTPNGTFYIIESATSGSAIYINSNGFSGTKGKFTTNQDVTWSIQGSTILAISQSGELSIKQNLSGSATQYPGTLTGTVKVSNTFNETATAPISVTLVDNVPATITNNVATSKKESEVNGAVGLGTVVITDPQSYENVQWVNFNGGVNFTTSSESPGQSVTYEVSSSGALSNGTYTFAISASDSYGQITKQLHTLVVSENLPPTIAYSGFTGTVDDATSGSNIGTATVTDPDAEGIAAFTITGTDAGDFEAHLVSSNSSTNVYNIQPNTDLAAGSYDISGSAKDNFGLETTSSISNAFTLVPPAAITSNDPFYIIESALSGDFVTSRANGVAGTKAKFSNAQPVTWSLQNTNVLAISQSGELTVNTNISGAFDAPGTFTATVVATNDGGSVTAPVSVTLVDNAAPTFTNNLESSINTADITSARGIGTITITDPLSSISYENVEIDTFDGASNFVISTETAAPSVTYEVSSSGAVSAGTYKLQFTGSDEYGNIVKTSHNVVVSTAAAAPITKNGNLYIIESAESGSAITTATSGIPGTQVQFETTTVGVTWSVSPTTYLHIDQDGYLSLQADVSGSVKVAGTTLDATVTAGTGASPETTLSISVLVTENQGPTVTDTVPDTVSDTVAVANATLGTITAIDPQALDNISSITITGGASQSEVTLGTLSTTTYSGSVDLKVGGSNMTAGAKAVQVTATDSFGKETVHNINFTVGSTPATTVFVYTNTVNAANLNGTVTQALTALGAAYYEDWDFADTGYALDQLQGATNFAQDFTATGTSYGSGVLDFIASGSINDLLDIQTFGNVPTSTTGKQVVFLFPSSSDMSSLPSTIAAVADLNNIPSGQHALVSYAQTPPVSPTGDVFYFDTDNPVHGYSRWGLAFTLDRQTGTNRWAIAASGDTIPS